MREESASITAIPVGVTPPGSRSAPPAIFCSLSANCRSHSTSIQTMAVSIRSSRFLSFRYSDFLVVAESVCFCSSRSYKGAPRVTVCTAHQTCAWSLQLISTSFACRSFAGSSRWLATAPAESSSAPLPSDPRLVKIVDDISGLTLLQAADLVTLLKVMSPPRRLSSVCDTCMLIYNFLRYSHDSTFKRLLHRLLHRHQ